MLNIIQSSNPDDVLRLSVIVLFLCWWQDAAGEDHAGRDLQRPLRDGGWEDDAGLVVQTQMGAAEHHWGGQRVHHGAGAETGGAAASQRREEVTAINPQQPDTQMLVYFHLIFWV